MLDPNGLHELNLPGAVEAIWHSLYFIFATGALGILLLFVFRRGQIWSRRIFMAGFSVLVFRTILVNIERWGGTLYWEGLPFDTLALVLLYLGFRVWVIEENEGPQPAGRRWPRIRSSK